MKRKQCLVAVGLVAALVLLSGCPPKATIEEEIPNEGIVTLPFSLTLEYEGVEKVVNGITVMPEEFTHRGHQTVFAVPGFGDNYNALRYLAACLAQQGYVVVVFDPDDTVNLFPADQPNRLIEFDKSGSFRRELNTLDQGLATVGYDPVLNLAWRNLIWVYLQTLRGKVDDPSALSECQALFDYRLAVAEMLIGLGLDESPLLPGSEAIDPEQIFAMGHSLGGATVLELIGAAGRTVLPIGTIKGALLLAPVSGIFSQADLAQINAPTRWIIATEDQSCVNVGYDSRYGWVPADAKETIVFEGATHAVFSYTFHRDVLNHEPDDECIGWQNEVVRIATQFFKN